VTGGDPRRAREGTVPGAGVLGMWVFLATLTVLFLAAIVGYPACKKEPQVAQATNVSAAAYSSTSNCASPDHARGQLGL